MPSRELVRLNRALRTQAEREARANGVSVKAGRVTSVNQAARIAQVRLNGQNTSAGVSWLGGAAPAVGDAVHVLIQGGAMTVLTGVHGTTPTSGTTTVIDNTVTVEEGVGFTQGTLAQRPVASSESLNHAYFAEDVEGGTVYICNGMSWVQAAPGVDEEPVPHTHGAEDIPDDEKLHTVLRQGNFEDRPVASADTLGHFYEVLDEEGGTLYGCNGMSWVLMAPPVLHEHEAAEVEVVPLPEGIPDAVDIDALLAGHRGNGVMGGAKITSALVPSMTVDVSLGVGWHVDGSVDSRGEVRVNAGSVTNIADGVGQTLPRLDLIVAGVPAVGAAAIVTAIAGTPAVSPVLPPIPAHSLVLAAVRIEPDMTVVTNADITDMRVLIPPPEVVHAADFGCSGRSGDDQSDAIHAALAAARKLGKILWLDGSNPNWSTIQLLYVTSIDVSRTVNAKGGNVRIYGPGVNSCKLRMMANTDGTYRNTPLLNVNGSFNDIQGFEISFLENLSGTSVDQGSGPIPTPPYPQPFGNTSARGLYITAELGNLSTLSRYQNLWIRNCGSGIYAPTQLFSNHFDTIEIQGFSKYGIWASHSGGSTGNVWTNLYLHNYGAPSDSAIGSRNPFAAEFGVYLQNHTESVFNQLNIEWCELDYGVFLDNSGVIVFNSLHFEGYVAGLVDAAFVYLRGGSNRGTRAIINAMFAYLVRIDGDYLGGSKSYFLFRCDSVNDEIEVHGLDIHEYGAYYWEHHPTLNNATTGNEAVNNGLFGRLTGTSTWTKGSAAFTGQYLPHLNRSDRWGGAGQEAGRNRPMARQGGAYPSFEDHSHRHFVAGGPTNLPTNAKWGFTYLPIVDLIANQVPSAVPTVEAGCVAIAVDYRNQRLLGYFATATSPQTAGWKQL